PSDMCVALAALDAIVRVRGPKAAREIPIAEFHRLPGNTPERDTNLGPDELVIAVDLPAMPFATHSHYLKVRDRASYAFALVSVATKQSFFKTPTAKSSGVHRKSSRSRGRARQHA